MSTPAHHPPAGSNRLSRSVEMLMAVCLAVMATSVFLNVVLRYGFGSGIAASEELSRLLFVWMVFLGGTAAYPRGEHMAFTSLLGPLKRRFGDTGLGVLTRLIHLLVLAACVMVGWGAWQQVVVGMGSRSVVLAYPTALLPLPALLSCTAIGLMALNNLLRGKPIGSSHDAEME
jgi:TRAP-type C4-dicarboxylate transport system permease small subunit